MLELRRILAGKAGGSDAGSVEHTVNDGRSV
jgi:hypothetical protein